MEAPGSRNSKTNACLKKTSILVSIHQIVVVATYFLENHVDKDYPTKSANSEPRSAWYPRLVMLQLPERSAAENQETKRI